MVFEWSSRCYARLCRWLLAIALGSGLTTGLAATPSPQNLPGSFLGNFAGIALTDKSGRPFQPAVLANHVVLFSFIYTRCGSICPTQTRALAQVLGELPADVRADVRFVSISIDPDNDSPQQLQAFARRMHADLDGWFFLTGDPARIEQLTQRLVLFDNNARRPDTHRTTLWLVDGQGRLVQRYQGDPPDAPRLIKELAQLSRMKSKSPPL